MPELETQSAAAELVAQGEALMRLENDSLLKVAIQRPRDEKKILEGALAELRMVPEEAELNFYSIPFKGPDGQSQFVEGPSIKAAMALARRWGNCSAGARILSEDATGVNVEGCFLDFETNFRVLRPHRVSRFLKRRDGRVTELDAQRLLMAIQAGASKALRNAILAGLPAYLVHKHFISAKQIVAGGSLDAAATPAQVDKAIAGFAKWNVTADQLERHLELPRTIWTGEEIAKLRGLYTAIKDGETTVEATFGIAPEGSKPKTSKAENALDGLTNKLQEEKPPAGEPSADDPRPGLLGAISGARAKLDKPLTEIQWGAACKEFCGTTVLETVDAAALNELLDFLRKVAAKDQPAVTRLKDITKGK